MAKVKGFGARKADESAYEQAIRLHYLRPFIGTLQDRLAQAESAAQVLAQLDDGVERIKAMPRSGVPLDKITQLVTRMEMWQRERLIRAFRVALSIDIRPYLTSPQVAAYMREVIDTSVDLIKTIPPR